MDPRIPALKKISFAVGSNIFAFFTLLIVDRAIFGNHETLPASLFAPYSYFVLPGSLFLAVGVSSFLLFFRFEPHSLRLKIGRTLMFTQLSTLPLFLAGYLSHHLDMKVTDNFYSIYLFRIHIGMLCLLFLNNQIGKKKSPDATTEPSNDNPPPHF